MINIITLFHTWKPLVRYHLSGEIFCITCFENITIQSWLAKQHKGLVIQFIKHININNSGGTWTAQQMFWKLQYERNLNLKIFQTLNLRTSGIRSCLGSTSQYSVHWSVFQVSSHLSLSIYAWYCIAMWSQIPTYSPLLFKIRWSKRCEIIQNLVNGIILLQNIWKFCISVHTICHLTKSLWMLDLFDYS